MKKYLVLFVLFVLFVPTLVSAHQPRLVDYEINRIEVIEPEISKAYYGMLSGYKHIFTIKSDEDFNLYVNVLIPNIKDQKKDVNALIIKDGEKDIPYAVLSSKDFEWKKFKEPFGNDNYLQGPEFKTKAESGIYEIIVYSDNNDSKYSLAIGEIESFDLDETINTLKLIPIIKTRIFEKNPVDFIFSPIGIIYIVIMFSLAFIFGFINRYILKLAARRKTSTFAKRAKKNIGKSSRILRFVISIVLFVWAITTTWSALLLFLSGFALFETIFSWCGFHALVGVNTCEVE